MRLGGEFHGPEGDDLSVWDARRIFLQRIRHVAPEVLDSLEQDLLPLYRDALDATSPDERVSAPKTRREETGTRRDTPSWERWSWRNGDWNQLDDDVPQSVTDLRDSVLRWADYWNLTDEWALDSIVWSLAVRCRDTAGAPSSAVTPLRKEVLSIVREVAEDTHCEPDPNALPPQIWIDELAVEDLTTVADDERTPDGFWYAVLRQKEQYANVWEALRAWYENSNVDTPFPEALTSAMRTLSIWYQNPERAGLLPPRQTFFTFPAPTPFKFDFQGWSPETRTWDEYETAVGQALQERLDKYRQRRERAYKRRRSILAEDGEVDLQPTPEKRGSGDASASQHFDWLIRFQVTEWTHEKLMDETDRGRTTVQDAIRDTAELIGLTRRSQ